MAVSLDTKVDLLLKKLSGVSKTDTGANKSPSNESIPSPSLNRGDTQWLNSYLIPATANSTLGTVESYFQNNRVQCTPDTTSQRVNNVYPTWKTGLTDWIPPEFDSVNIVNTYRVKVFYGNPNLTDPQASGGTQIFADGSLGQGEWFFDYQSGVLNFFGNTPIPSGMTSSHVIYILGWRYVGPKGFNSVFKVDTPVMRGDLLLPTLITLKGDTVVEKNLVVEEDLEIQGGDLTTTENVFNLLNTTAETINFAGAATSLVVGAVTGTTNIRNNLDVDGDVVIDGDELKTTSTTFNLIPDAATTVNFAQAATSIILGATTGTTNIRNDLDVDGDLNVDGSFHIGEDLDVDGDLNIDGGDLTVSTTTFNLANEVATTVNFAGDATVVEIGSTTGTTSVNNNLDVDLDMHIGQNLDVDGDVNIDGGDLTVSTETFNLANETAKNVNFAGEATNIEIGSQEGVTNVNNNFKVDGDTTFGNRLTVDGIVDVNNSLYVEGQARVNQSLEVEDSVKVQNELAVEGDTQITKDLNVGGYIKAGKLVDTMIDCGEY
ncbi:hypothetical protein EBU71_13185 [bacterium]|nr:hypothetical protein [Candidatus Elulimicrobium humile]